MKGWTTDKAMGIPAVRDALRKQTERDLAGRLPAPVAGVKPHPSSLSPNAPGSSSRAISFTVHGAPVSPNAAYKRSRQGRMFMTPEGKAWKQAVANCAAVAMGTQRIIEGPYHITLRPFFPSRRFDLASVEKLTSDAMQGIVFTNDRNARRIVLEWGLDRERPRVECFVEEVR